jgi:glutamine amidotransferase
MQQISILKYNAGNTQSVIYALQRLGINPLVTDDVEVLQKSDKIIFPGVGEASSAMQYLKRKNLDKLLISLKQPVLGICLGMQLMGEYSEENQTRGLGIFPTQIKLFPKKQSFKVPHVGWNTLQIMNNHSILKGLEAENKQKFVYYVHSYYMEISDFTIATTDYILPFSAAIQKDNFYATQFHPEKSAEVGNLILANFLAL